MNKSDQEDFTAIGHFWPARQLQILSESEYELQKQAQEDKVKLSVYFIIAYLAYLAISYIILRFVSKFDLILGLVSFMRKTNSSSGCIKVTVIVYLIYFLVCPIIIALAWSFYIYDKTSGEDDAVIAAAIFLMIMFSTFVILGMVFWYGAKWHVSKAVIVFLSLGAFSAWLFTLTVSLTEKNYTYSGASAILLATNFIPACYILQKKTVWKDLPLYALFRALAKQISNQTEDEHLKLMDLTPVQRRDKANASMRQTLIQITEDENSSLKCRLIIVSVIYFVTMAVYLGVFVAKEDDDTIRGLALLNPVFILASDIVIISLREQSVKIRVKEGQGSLIYSPTFQSMILLFNRVLLCYNKEYWLMNQALVYFIVQCVCAFDATQTIFLRSQNVRDEQTDIIEILRICPVLQAKVQNTLPELKTNFDYMPPTCCCDFGEFCTWRKFRTQVASFVYFLFFIGLNYLCSKEPESLQTKRVVFVNEVGQWVYGYFAIAATIVLVFYILWYRSFKNSNYVFTCSALLLYLLFQGISIGIGLLFHESVGGNIDLILTSFILLPIIVVSFSAFFGIWVSNEYHAYEMDYLQGKNFKPEEIDAYNKLGSWEKIKHGAWRPRTGKDWVFFLMIFINILTIIAYLIATAIMFKPEYVGITIGLLMIVFETSFIMLWKYRATNFQMQASVVAPMLTSVCTMIVWIVYMVFDVILDEDEPDYFKGGAIFICVAYFVILIGTLLYMEYQSVDHHISHLSCSFWILFGITFLILIGVGGAAINFTEYGLFGIIWIAMCIYVLLNMLLHSFRKIIAVLFSICFIVAGIFLLMTSDDSDQSFQGMSVLYFGMFILSFGAFCQEYVTNKLKKRKSIFMNAPEVFPMLEYNLDSSQMKNSNAEPMLFFFFIYIVLLWAFSTTIIADQKWRYIPLSIIGITLAFAYIYIIEKNVDATTIDRKFFKQATPLFYTSCLVTATDYKKRWRNSDRDIKDIAEDNPEQEFALKQQYENRLVFLNELNALKDWAKLIGLYKKDLGFIGFWESMSVQPDKSDNHRHSNIDASVNDNKIVPLQKSQPLSNLLDDSQSQNLNKTKDVGHQNSNVVDIEDLQAAASKSRLKKQEGNLNELVDFDHHNGDEQIDLSQQDLVIFESETGDQTLEKLARMFESYVGKPTKEGELIDTWCELIMRAREEDYFDKKYWAFLNGYLNLKMAQLLENELSIIEITVKMYIRELKTQNPETKVDESMGIGRFLAEIKDEPDVLVGFTIYIAEEFLKETKGKKDETDKIDDIIPVNGNDWNSSTILEQNIKMMKEKFGPENHAKFNMEVFQKDQQEMIANVLLERSVDIMKNVEESRKRDEERERRRQAEDEASRFEQDSRERRRNIKMDEVQQVGADEDEKLLKIEGDQRLNEIRSSGNSHFDDTEFSLNKAKGDLKMEIEYLRVQDMVDQHANRNFKGTTTVFSDGVSAGDVKQGMLGDCYLLSAMSIIAHSRPELIKKIFHPESRVYRQEGIYSIMMYSGKVPMVITVDDKFFCKAGKQSAFARMSTDRQTHEREIWPLLIEKAYAKKHGSFSNIVGGQVSKSLEELTNGVSNLYRFRDKKFEQEFNTGELWTKMLFWKSKNYLMGTATPGKGKTDSDISSMGLAYLHAYSILDVATIDGNKLVQIRNPWGNETEWQGAWGDKSDEWNERRKKEAYKRMKEQVGRVDEIGKCDGIFWMAFHDFFINFDTLYLCRFFDQDYTEVFFESEWSKINATAGGCSNYDTVGYNPQLKLVVDAKNSSVPVEVFIDLSVQASILPNQELSNKIDKKIAIGFEFYSLKGERVKGKSQLSGNRKISNQEGYRYTSSSVTYDGAIKDTGSDPLTVLITTFKPDFEAKFRFSIHYKHQQGTVSLKKI